MSASSRLSAILIMSAAAGGSALAGTGMTVRILNDTPDDLTVTVLDRTVRPAQAVVSGAVVNGNASISVPIGTDASGRGQVSWTAYTVGRDMRRCGSARKRAVEDGATIRVFANRRCPAS